MINKELEHFSEILFFTLLGTVAALHREHVIYFRWHPLSSYQGYHKYLSAVQCSGKESRLIDCPHSLAGSGSVATLQCSTSVSCKYYMNEIALLSPPGIAEQMLNIISMTLVLYYCRAPHTHSKGPFMLTINTATQFECQRFCRLPSSLTFLQQLYMCNTCAGNCVWCILLHHIVL